MARLILLIISALAFFFVRAQHNLASCGDANYYTDEFACYQVYVLCRKENGNVYLRCADSCYSPFEYSCSIGQLVHLLDQQKSFTLSVSSPATAIHGQTIEASGGFFRVGGGPSSYCPEFLSQEMCKSFTSEKTILYPGSGMSVVVPGGQQYYVAPDGRLSYTGAHQEDDYPVNSTFGVAAYETGGFIFSPKGWTAQDVF
ncbi:hypothetical protein DFH09DRAFT_1492599 [Mycena vulgaris]|nr:hypothetical protein DFH09DRAFT_1492599 [Mycena vulgaris]